MSFEVGDSVIDIRHGAGIITEILKDNNPHLIIATFQNKDIRAYFLEDGRTCYSDYLPTLYHAKDFVYPSGVEPERLPFKCGDLVLVRKYQDEHWKCHIFQKYEEDIDSHYVCKNGFGYNFCIPYKGNEELLDTMREPEE